MKRNALTALAGALWCMAAIAQAFGQTPSLGQDASALWTRRARDLAVVEHIRRHLQDPQDGLSLAADCRDLRRIRADASVAGPAGAAAPASPKDPAQALAELAVVAEIWDARVNGRTPFGLMGRERTQALEHAEAALSRLGSQLGSAERDYLVPALQEELGRLRRYMQSSGDASESMIDMALAMADAAAAGRPVVVPPVYPGPARPDYGAPPYTGPPAPPGGTSPPPPGSYPPPPPGGYPPPPSPGAPPGLPPGYAAYASPAAGGCRAERNRAGQVGDAAAMLRVADCWSRDRGSFASATQVIEALDWALEYALIARDCTALDSVIEKIRSQGSLASPYPQDIQRLSDLARRAEQQRTWLRSRSTCR